ncbi:TPA: hypothetical protein JI317_14360, partial [Acinetobacter baumannii]
RDKTLKNESKFIVFRLYMPTKCAKIKMVNWVISSISFKQICKKIQMISTFCFLFQLKRLNA